MKLFDHFSLLLALSLVIPAYSRKDVNFLSIQEDFAHKDLTPRDEIYDQAVERGKAFLAQFSSNQYSAPITTGTVADSEDQGWTIEPSIPMRVSTPDDPLTVVLQELVGGTLRNKYHEWRASFTSGRKHASYNNLYGPKDGVIVALNNHNSLVSVPMSNWSEISWRIWTEICQSESIDPKTLKYIVRHSIVSEETLKIIMLHIYPAVVPRVAMGDRIILFPNGETLQAFQALLGSPNGRGVAWMLLNKRNVLAKSIAKITVEMVQKRSWYMWFELQEIAVAPSSAVIE